MVHVSPIIAYYLLCLRITFEDVSLEIIYTGRLECTLHHNKTGLLLKNPNSLLKNNTWDGSLLCVQGAPLCSDTGSFGLCLHRLFLSWSCMCQRDLTFPPVGEALSQQPKQKGRQHSDIFEEKMEGLICRLEINPSAKVLILLRFCALVCCWCLIFSLAHS